MKAFVALLLGAMFSPILAAQQPKPEPTPTHNINQMEILELPKRATYKPALTLQNALKIADRYIVEQKIDISKYYLLEAKYTLYGSKDTQDPAWYFCWVNEDGASGHYVELVVSIKTRNVRRLMSM